MYLDQPDTEGVLLIPCSWNHRSVEPRSYLEQLELHPAHPPALDPEDRERAQGVIADFLSSWRYCPVATASNPSRSCLEDAAGQLLDALASHQGGGGDLMAREVTVRMSERAAMQFRYILPILLTALDPLAPGEDKDDLLSAMEQVIKELDRALPSDLRAKVDERYISEKRMDAIDLQREAGVRPGPACKCGHRQLDHPKQGPDCGPGAHPERQVE